MPFTIAMTGKGGVGKTTLSALAIDWLVRHAMTPVLAVDADSNANLHEALGVAYAATVGGIREDARKQAAALKGVSKQEYLDLRIHDALVEQRGFDLIVMGRPEGQGCYCFANNVLREVLDKLARNYRNIVLDSEAGLEHISRRTLLSVDCLFIVSDCTVRGIRTAGRIAALADEVKLPTGMRGLIVNRVPGGELPDAVRREAELTGLPLAAVIPLDENVAAADAEGAPAAGLAEDAPARLALEELLVRTFLRKEEGRVANPPQAPSLPHTAA
jgi:CO dehydrogenase maturation factor